MNTHFLRDIKAVQVLATRLHAGQKRKNGDPYITHPIRVSESLNCYAYDHPEHVIPSCAALLHDVVEDCISAEGLAVELTKLAVNGSIARSDVWNILDVVVLLTRTEGMSLPKYASRIKSCPYATEVKLADLADNLSDLEPGHQRDKYELMAHYLTT